MNNSNLFPEEHHHVQPLRPLGDSDLPMMPRWLRFRFSLRGLLFVTVLVAACFGGWATHRRQQRQAYLRDVAVANELYERFRRTSDAQRTRPLGIDESMMIIDGLEHRQRMERLQKERRGP